ncbi:2-amino-4-hydroxy-6-hydroxymethyldihydropteridine diphosphokinase [Granulosicoccaceae sp. 1_MG-2023]|nr:2-amino-4-hydroxy-6-hydroxymethyldihydropteridine diphosphokinase [Granulosicoccaceae sp. 1_MG-2023]
MTRVCIGMRSNHAPEASLRKAIALVGQLFREIEVSPVYRAPLSSAEDESDFALSMAIAGETDKSADEVVAFLNETHARFDQPAAQDAGELVMELTLLLYGGAVLSVGDVEVPSPRIEDLAGLLIPLTDVAAGQTHPLSDRPFLAMRDELLARDPGQAGKVDEVPFAF